MPSLEKLRQRRLNDRIFKSCHLAAFRLFSHSYRLPFNFSIPWRENGWETVANVAPSNGLTSLSQCVSPCYVNVCSTCPRLSSLFNSWGRIIGINYEETWQSLDEAFWEIIADKKNVWKSDKSWEPEIFLKFWKFKLKIKKLKWLKLILGTCWTTFVFMSMLKSHCL